jgi:uncharacterized protein YtpQ (UPF0354 family)
MRMQRRKALFAMAAAGAALAVKPARNAAAQSKDPLPRTKDYVVALVRSHPAVDPKSRPVQKIEAAVSAPDPKATPDNALVFDHFVGDLHLRYAFDDPQFTVYLHQRDLKRLAITRDELPALVVSNYRRLYPKLTVARPERWLGTLTGGGELEPCAMLDGAFWERQRKEFRGELIAAVPSAHEIYFTPREPKQNVELLKHLAILHYEKAGKRAVSRTVFAWRFFRWEVLI